MFNFLNNPTAHPVLFLFILTISVFASILIELKEAKSSKNSHKNKAFYTSLKVMVNIMLIISPAAMFFTLFQCMFPLLPHF